MVRLLSYYQRWKGKVVNVANSLTLTNLTNTNTNLTNNNLTLTNLTNNNLTITANTYLIIVLILHAANISPKHSPGKAIKENISEETLVIW